MVASSPASPLAAAWVPTSARTPSELGSQASGPRGFFGSSDDDPQEHVHAPGPSCMFLGPIEAADQPSLEEFYRQAKDSYYSGRPLVLDDMFDKVEVHLRWLRSPVVQKFPRCSLQSFTTYSDAEDDPSQMGALFVIWSALLALGGVVAVGPWALSLYLLWMHATSEDAALGISSLPDPLLTTTWILTCVISTGLGLTLASCAGLSLQSLRSGSTVALKGVCPSCTEEVYAFVKVDGREKRPRHKTECHVCGQRLVFHAILRQPQPKNVRKAGLSKVEDRVVQTKQSSSAGEDLDQHWVYGRVYAVARPEDLKPH